LEDVLECIGRTWAVQAAAFPSCLAAPNKSGIAAAALKQLRASAEVSPSDELRSVCRRESMDTAMAQTGTGSGSKGCLPCGVLVQGKSCSFLKAVDIAGSEWPWLKVALADLRRGWECLEKVGASARQHEVLVAARNGPHIDL
jgi:hypothetical protein